MSGNLRDTVRLVVISLTLSVACNFQYGFSSTYMNTPVDQFKAYLNESFIRRGHVLSEGTYDLVWNLIANIWFVGFFIGIWLSPLLNDRFGRKVGFISMNAVSLIASVLRFVGIVVYSPECLFVGRLLASISVAVTYQSLILFLQECSPTRFRGALTFTSEISYAVMALLGMFLGMDAIFGRHLHYLLGFAVIPCALSLIVLFPMHETPKFLYIVRGDKKGASESITYYHGKSADVAHVLHEISLEAEQESSAGDSSLREIFATPHLRKAVFLSCLALQNTVALWSLLLSSTDFLKHAKLNTDIAEWSSTGMALAYVIGTVLGSTCVEKYGRRIMLLTFSSANTGFLFLYVVFAALQPYLDVLQYGCLVCFLAYGFTYGFGVGPITWFLSSELVPQRHRSLVQSVCYAINTIMVIISTFTILPLFEVIDAYAFLALYVIPSVISIVVLFFQLPETKGREIHEIVAELKGKIRCETNDIN
uniref:MFS domain-containing protein n=1 Tax=Panagrellus redivivus TaxID=6233 RepID=A0A7E4WCQ7_PANRE